MVNLAGERLGHVRDLMIDLMTGAVAYAVLSRPGHDRRLFALPWHLIAVDGDEEKLVVDVDREVLDSSPGFDVDDWPRFSDLMWQEGLHHHFDVGCWAEPDVGVGI